MARAGPATAMETPENATTVTFEQIQALPSSSRNFLDLAQLAPGVRLTPDRINGTDKSFASGALPADAINVFVDGRSLKNDITVGGIVGQDRSRGNPFPRNALQEVRIVTNNFKAEYGKASSAIITAITRSGGNQWRGSVFSGFQSQSLVALDTFQLADEHDTLRATPVEKPEYSRVLTGFSGGGPLVQNKLFVFGAYEGNYQNRQGITRFNGDSTAWPTNIAALQGESHSSPFRSSLFFGKLSYNHGEKQRVELSTTVRHETDRRGFGGQFSDTFRAFQAGENLRNNVIDGGLRHTVHGHDWLNESLIGYQWYQLNPEPFDLVTPGQEYPGIGRIGGGDSRQTFQQKRLSLRDAWTYSGLHAGGAHVIKIGGNVDLLRYNIDRQLNENPTFTFSSSNGFAFPVQAQIGTGNPMINGRNSQLGLYLQDDWSPTSALTLNLGIRWDYESGMYDRKYVTPPATRDSLVALRDALFIDIDPSRYFTDGTRRKAFAGAFQPRLGFSYTIDAHQRTSLFAAVGVFYDRIGFNSLVDETYRRQHPSHFFNFSSDGGNGTIAWDPTYLSRAGLASILGFGLTPPQEVFLLPNNLKPPKSYQFSGGVRHNFGTIATSLVYTGIRGRNGFSYEWANVALDPATNDCCQSVATPYQNVLVGNNSVRNWYDGVEARVDRPYHRSGEFGWGAGIAYTLSWASTEGGALFSFPTITAGFNRRHPIDDDRRHRVVVNWVADLPFVFGIQFSGLATVASGTPYRKVSFVGGTGTERVNLGFEHTPPFRNIDLRVRKDLPDFGGTRLGITGDLFNALNTQNLGCFQETFRNGDGSPNPNFAHATCVTSDPRRFQLGFQYDF
ncbi:MAG: TonB-dependent receptor [Gemmatimonadales bacterium]|nr:TonB-dependent receptor [Gemmatimonadales bacterium]